MNLPLVCKSDSQFQSQLPPLPISYTPPPKLPPLHLLNTQDPTTLRRKQTCWTIKKEMTNLDLSLTFPGSSMFALSITSRTRSPSSNATRRWRLFNPEVRKRSPTHGHKPLEGWTYKNRVPWQMKRLKSCTNAKEEFSIYYYDFFYDFCCTIFNILLIGNKYAKVKYTLKIMTF